MVVKSSGFTTVVRQTLAGENLLKEIIANFFSLYRDINSMVTLILILEVSDSSSVTVSGGFHFIKIGIASSN